MAIRVCLCLSVGVPSGIQDSIFERFVIQLTEKMNGHKIVVKFETANKKQTLNSSRPSNTSIQILTLTPWNFLISVFRSGVADPFFGICQKSFIILYHIILEIH